MSVDGLLTFVSPAWTEKLGYDASEIEGQSFVPLIHPDDTEICHGAIKRILATGTPQEAPRTGFATKTEAGGGITLLVL